MRLRPMPVVMVSSLTERGGEITLRALELGAIDFVTKPKLGIRDGLLEYTEIIADKIRAASRALRAAARARGRAAPALRRPLSSSEKLVIGASTGGTEAIREVLQPLPPDSPAILITQHMPAGFTRSFAQRLDALCAVTVREAVHGERVLPGHVYLAPGGDTHMRLAAAAPTTSSNWTPANPSTATARRWTCCSFGRGGGGQERHRRHPDRHGQGRRRGHARHARRRHTIAQDEASCVVFGMPREAIAIGAAEEVVSLSAMSERILTRLGDRGHRV